MSAPKLAKTLRALSLLMDDSTSLLMRARDQAEWPVEKNPRGGHMLRKKTPLGAQMATMEHHHCILKESFRKADAVREALKELAVLSAGAQPKSLAEVAAEYDPEALKR